MKFWELKPVQTGAKAFGAGFVALGILYAYNKSGEYLAKRSDIPLVNLKRYLLNDPKLKGEDLDIIWALDPDSIELLLRLETFRKFAPFEYAETVQAFKSALNTKDLCYSRGELSATSSFNIRKAYQVIIEKIRVFRAVVERSIPTAIDDFDEIAVDINAKVEQASSDAIQDTFIN